MKPNNLFHIDLKVYIAGVRMPVQSVTITTGFNLIPRATISLPPDSRLYGIGRRDRVPVHVFITDTFSGVNDVQLGIRSSDTYGKDILIYEGEISAFSYHSTAIGKEFVINAQGLLTFMEDINLQTLNSTNEVATTCTKGEDLVGMRTMGTLTSQLPASLFTRGLFNPKENNTIQYPYEFLENSVKYITGAVSNAETTTVGNFYREYTSKKLNLINRIAPMPGFDDDRFFGDKFKSSGFPILKALQDSAVINTLTGLAEDAKTAGSLIDFINVVVNHMEYETAFPNSPTVSGTKVPFMYLKPLMYEALPPLCNIIYRSMCSSLSTSETVYKVPTRIRTADLYGATANVSHGANSQIAKYEIYDFWPKGVEDKAMGNDNKNKVTETLLPSESTTGPYMYETQGPRWMSYFSRGVEGAAAREFNDTIRKHMLLLKIYESRNMSITMPYNPFLVTGYPAVVYDAEDTGFTFIGHLMNVEHTITEHSATTVANLAFVRLVDDELNDVGNNDDLAATNTQLHNTVKEISDLVTKKHAPMHEIYQEVLGCGAVKSFQDLKDGDIYKSDAHENPAEAYMQTYRRIVTFEEYAKLAKIHNPYGNQLKDTDGGTLLADLKPLISGQDLTETLLEIANHIKENGIYSTSFSID